jgi:hypothetical protein
VSCTSTLLADNAAHNAKCSQKSFYPCLARKKDIIPQAKFGVIFPKETLDLVEKHKSKYISRNQYIVRAVEHYLSEKEGENFLEVNAS